MFKTTKSKVIFVAIFCILCIVVTVGLVLYKNIEINDEIDDGNKEEVITNKEKDVAGIDVKGTYNQNDLMIDEKRTTTGKAEVLYKQIYGLKNKMIQDSINDEIREVALNCYKDKVKDLNQVINVSVSMSKMANYSNVLSLETYYVAKKDDNGDGVYSGYKCLNYDLTTGEKIPINKVFTSDAPIEDILRDSAYYSFLSNGELDMNLAGDLIVKDYTDIEDKVANFIYAYKMGRITDFSFSTNNIYIYYGDDGIVTIDMEKYADYIAIYNRYLTNESIFEVSSIGLKNLFTLTDREKDVYYYTNYQKESNYLIDLSISCYDEDDEYIAKFLQNKIKDMEAEIEKVKAYANKDSNKFYILNYHIYVSLLRDNLTADRYFYYNEAGNVYDMTVHDFEEVVSAKIRKDIKNKMNGGEVPDFLYDFSDELKVAPQNVTEYYDKITGEKAVI